MNPSEVQYSVTMFIQYIYCWGFANPYIEIHTFLGFDVTNVINSTPHCNQNATKKIYTHGT